MAAAIDLERRMGQSVRARLNLSNSIGIKFLHTKPNQWSRLDKVFGPKGLYSRHVCGLSGNKNKKIWTQLKGRVPV